MSASEKELLVLVDGNNVTFRSLFALWRTGLTSPKGRDARALYGNLGALRTYFQQFQPSHMIWFFDKGRSEYRTSIHPGYKGNRRYGTQANGQPDIRDLLIPQYEAMEHVLGILGIPSCSEYGVEADDLIAQAVRRWSPEIETLIVSGDSDLLQLVSAKPKVTVFQPGKENRRPMELGVTADQVEAWWGVPPSRIPEVKAMTGDTSDNIDGIRGIGNKRAVKILKRYDTLLDAINNAPELADHKKLVARNYLLTHLDGQRGWVNFSLNDCEIPPLTKCAEDGLQGFFDEWGFTRLKPSSFRTGLMA